MWPFKKKIVVFDKFVTSILDGVSISINVTGVPSGIEIDHNKLNWSEVPNFIKDTVKKSGKFEVEYNRIKGYLHV